MSAEHFDLVVVGGGMAGMTAAGMAAQAGLRVCVLERAGNLGGSALMGENLVWSQPSFEVFKREAPGGNEPLQRALVEIFPDLVAWLRDMDVGLSPPVFGISGLGVGYRIDMPGFLKRCAELVERSDGRVLVSAEPRELVVTAGEVAGVRYDFAGEQSTAKTTAVVLATGGWQASAEMRREYLNKENGERIVVRSNLYSDGGGYRLASNSGAKKMTPQSAFYGRLMPAPVRNPKPSVLLTLSAMYSEHCVLVNLDGRRFVDESMGDGLSSPALVAQPQARGLLLADDHVHRRWAQAPHVPGGAAADRFEVARSEGANIASAETFEELAAKVEPWGFQGAKVLSTIHEFNQLARGAPERLRPSYARGLRPLDSPPYWAIEVQPAITFTYAGIAVDADTRVIRDDGSIVRGLYAVGADVGEAFTSGYCGGLSLAGCSALLAARHAAASRNA